MRPATGAVTTLLNTWNPRSQNAVADLYTFTLITGEVLRYSGYQVALSAPAPNTSTPLLSFLLGPIFNRTKTKTIIGTQVDQIEIDIFAGTTDLIGTLTWQNAFHAGLFDGAICEVDRAFMSPPGTVIGTITWFYGRVADVEIGRTQMKLKVASLLDLLTVQMPRRLYQASCTFVFGKQMCGYDRIAGKNALGVSTGLGQVTITAQAGSDQNSITTIFAPSPATAYDQGSIIGTSGLNTGYTRTIGKIGAGVIYFLKPWFFPVAVNDAFHLLPGCDHTLPTCTNTFQNQLRFGGFPYIPPPETAF
jgi:uncharacterized phage protein (TIGR02218 family)